MSKCDCEFFELDRDDCCNAEAITLRNQSSQPVRWYCTRLDQHDGDHVACEQNEHDLFHWGSSTT